MSAATCNVTITYRLIWVTSLGYAGSDHSKEYATPEAAMADATDGLTWTKEGHYDQRSSVDQYGDVYFIKGRASY